MAVVGRRRLHGLAARAELGTAQVIRIDRLWLRSAPSDIGACAERLLACVVQV
jgi:hypothetical protein